MNITLGPHNRPFSRWSPSDGRVFERFAFAVRSTAVDERRPYLVPAFVLAAACDDRRGVFVGRDDLLPFLRAHWDARMVCHDAAFALKVLSGLVEPHLDVYEAVERNSVWCTKVLNRLYSLATAGHTARDESGLQDCVRVHLKLALADDVPPAGGAVGDSFATLLGRDPSDSPSPVLDTLARHALATWHLFSALFDRIRNVLAGMGGVYGYAGPDWLKDAVARYGPLTHNVQLRASILVDVLRRNGIATDPVRTQEKAHRLEAIRKDARERLWKQHFLVDAKNSGQVLQSILDRFLRFNRWHELPRTASGKWSTTHEDLAPLAAEDEFFAHYLRYRGAETLLSTHLRKGSGARVHPGFGYLLKTGRTWCEGVNLQNLPRENNEAKAAATVRGCFVPAPGHVFIDSDYSQIELVVLGHVWEKQFGRSSNLARLINSGEDLHRLIAAAVLDKDPAEVTREERESAKPVSFGCPGGMRAKRLQALARANYGVNLSLGEVQSRIDAYHRLCPELRDHLRDEAPPGLKIARTLGLSLASYSQAGCDLDLPFGYSENPEPCEQMGWKVLEVLRGGAALERAELDYFWGAAQRLPLSLKGDLLSALRSRRADDRLWAAVRDWAGRRPVLTLTGRLWADATFCASRNCLFQGVAADGAVLGLWKVWRAGHRLVAFVHDQVVTESPDDGNVPARADEVNRLMGEGMLQVVPGMRVRVETVITRSLDKRDLDPRFAPGSGPGQRRPLQAVPPGR